MTTTDEIPKPSNTYVVYKPIYLYIGSVAVILLIGFVTYASVVKGISGNNMAESRSVIHVLASMIRDIFPQDYKINKYGRKKTSGIVQKQDESKKRPTANEFYGETEPLRECTEEELEAMVERILEKKGFFKKPPDININFNTIIYTSINNINDEKPCQPKPNAKIEQINERLDIVVKVLRIVGYGGGGIAGLVISIKALSDDTEVNNDGENPESKPGDKKLIKPKVIALNQCRNEIKRKGGLRDRLRREGMKTEMINDGFMLIWKLDNNKELICFYNERKGSARLQLP